MRSLRSAALPLAVAAALLAPAAAFAQANRTWVSGVGDDANPCSRTAPCKTWAGAIAKTIAGGEIDALDPGGFGTVTITKSITLDGGAGQVGSVLASGTAGITISAGSSDVITIRNVGINGINGTGQPGTVGVNILNAGTVHLENDHIFGFNGNGVLFNSGAINARLTISNSLIEDNAGSGLVAVSGSGGGAEQALVRDSTIDSNGCGLTAGTLSCGSGPTNALGVVVDSINTQITNNGYGKGTGATGAAIFSSGTYAAQVLSGDVITGNQIGLDSSNSGAIFSFSNNQLFGNVTNGNTSGSVSPRVRSMAQVESLIQSRVKQAKTKKSKHKHAQKKRSSHKRVKPS